ncbi:hypothetical protein CS542_05145 [Pedobacter sp. IW39]|nr:hypothetical protein CS542_05145 [Pedobacter sp. IW39]
MPNTKELSGPQIRGDVLHKPSYMPGSSLTPYNSLLSHSRSASSRPDKILSVLKVYPNRSMIRLIDDPFGTESICLLRSWTY